MFGMLKTLRITSLAAVILAACGVLGTAFFGFKDDPEKAAVLEKPSVTEQFKGLQSKADQKEGDIHPLVTQAKAFALRINPPPPPPPPQPKNPPAKTTPKPELARQVTPPPSVPRPPVITSFQVLATVRYETEPSRSLALLKSGSTLEWFRQGEKAGHLTIDEVRDGSIVVSQGGRNPQTLHVPAKQESKSLLKGDNTAVASGPSTASMPGAAVSTASFVSESGVVGGMPNPATRSRTLTSRVGRTRTPPPAPTPAQKKEELEQTITGIQDIMNRQDDAMTDEQRQAENQMWTELLNVLKSEKESLASADKTSTAQANAAEQNESPSAEEAAAEPVPGQTPEVNEGEGGEGEQVPAEPAEGEGEMPVQEEVAGEAGAEFAPTDEVPAEADSAAPEEGVAGEGDGSAEGFEPAARESGEAFGAEAGPAEGEGDPSGEAGAVPNEY